jgi:hypothetical protein
MATQNINNYYFNRFNAKLNNESYTDFFLVADETEVDNEVIYSNNVIAYNDGNRLPIYIDLNDAGSTQVTDWIYGEPLTGSPSVSLNYYNPNGEDISCYNFSGLCDAGLTGIDNGLFTGFTGQTLYYSMGIDQTKTFSPNYFDRRFKMFPVTGNTTSQNRFSGVTAQTLYNIITKTGITEGQYYELYGGFLQGFYKLYGYDYEVFPERPDKGWTAEILLRPRLTNYYSPSSGQTTLNQIYPENSNTFFFLGTRAENKFYHFASGSPITDSGYTRVTETIGDCVGTCACYNTGVTNSDCVNLYPSSAITINYSNGTPYTTPESRTVSPIDAEEDVYSNAFSVRFKGDMTNPKMSIKFIQLTGSCVTTGSCETSGVGYESGYTITEISSESGIYDSCYSPIDGGQSSQERWVLIDIVFERNITWTDCDLINRGGLGDLRKMRYTASTYNNTLSLLSPPETHTGNTYPSKVEIINLDRKWLDQKSDRLGKLKIYVNGRLFLQINDFEEIIPRELSETKEKQIGVPFNISLGGGSFGLRESLTVSGCSGWTGNYIQDPEVMANETLSGTSLSGLTTPILIEPNFAGTFDGSISQFRMYSIPLKSPQTQHNFRVLKNQFNLLNLFANNCNDTTLTLTPTPTPTVTPTITPTPTLPARYAYLFIETYNVNGVTGNQALGQYMYDLGNTNFYGFTNGFTPDFNNDSQFELDMNQYIDYSGWTSGSLPEIRTQIVPRVSGGEDEFGNPIVAQNFTTHEIPAGTVDKMAWYTWIIPTGATIGIQDTIDYNNNGNPNILTSANLEDDIKSVAFEYTGSTLPTGTYRVYTTFADTAFRLTNNETIYFKGGSVIG